MNASLQQIPNLSPSPVAHSGTAELSPGHARFDNILGAAIKKSDARRQQQSPQAAASKAISQPERHNKPSQPATNPQTPPLVAVPADSTGKLPPVVLAQGQLSGIDNALANGSKRSAHGVKTLAALAAGQFQPDVRGIKHAAVAATELPKQLNVTQAASQTGQNSLQADTVALTESSPSHSPQAVKGQPASSNTQVISSPASQKVLTPSMLFDALGPAVTKPAGQVQTGNAILEFTNQTRQAPETAKLQPPVETPPEVRAKPLQAQNKTLQRALTEMENLQIGFFSRATSENAAPVPTGLQGAKTFSVHGTNGCHSANSADALRQKQEMTVLQNRGRDAGGSNTGAGQEAGTGLPLNAAASGSSSDSSKDAKSGQDLPARHYEVSGPQGSETNSSPGSLNSVAASATATAATMMSIAASQSAPANSGPPTAGSLQQPVTTHTVVADKLMASVENPLNLAGGVINTASMLQAQGKTEMRIAMQTETLGPLELHAVLDGGHLGASIAVVNHEAHTLLTNNLPSLQQVLNDQNLRVDHLSVLNAATSSGTNTGSGGGFQSGGQPQSPPDAPRWGFSPQVQVAVGGKDASVVESLRGRLSVRA